MVDVYVKANIDSVYPLLLISFDQGTVKLKHFIFMKQLKEKLRDLEMMIIMTKFSAGWNNEWTQMFDTIKSQCADLDEE